MINLTDQDVLFRLSAFEDAFVERKTVSDSKDWLKTVVAFANSAPVGDPAILFIGVRNDGQIEGNANLDSLQRTLSEKLALAYPPIYCLPKVLQQNGKQFLAVIIPGSADRPHFAGPAYVRDGSQSIVSSAKQFDRLIAERNSKTYDILKWKEKTVTLKRPEKQELYGGSTRLIPANWFPVTLLDCNQFFVTLRSVKQIDAVASFPLGTVELNFDHVEKRLELILEVGSLPLHIWK